MSNLFRRLFSKNKKEDREVLTENEAFDDSVPEQIEEPIPQELPQQHHEVSHEEINLFEQHFGVDPENIQNSGMGSTRRLSFDNPLYDPNFGPIQTADAHTQYKSTAFWPLPDVKTYPDLYENKFGLRNVYHPHRRDAQLQTPRAISFGGYKLGEYEVTKNFEEDILLFKQAGVFINCNVDLGKGASGARVFGGYYYGITDELNNKKFAVKVWIYQDPNEPRIDVEKEKEIMNSLDFKYLIDIHNVVNMGDVRPMTAQKVLQDEHGNIDLIDQSYTSSDRIYLFMEFADLGPMNEYIKRHPPFNSNQLRALTYQLLEGLRYLHSQGVCHGDLHAGNVFLCSDHDHIDLSSLGIGQSAIDTFEVNFTAKLADFGMSEQKPDSVRDMKMIGLWVFSRAYIQRNFDNSQDESAYLSLVDRIRISPNVQTVYQSTELRNWFKIM